MGKKTYALSIILVLSLTLFLVVLFSNSTEEDTASISDKSIDALEGKESETELSLDKYFIFETPEESDTINEKFVPRPADDTKEECVLDGEFVREGTVSSNTTCVNE